VVVWLDPEEFKSTWLGNKSIYRTRMMIADDGELVVLAPGVRTFGEDPAIDRLIRKYGYRTTPEILAFTEANNDLKENLSAAAHLIHGSPENRFRVTYAAGHLSREEVESVGYRFGDLALLMKRYDPRGLRTGFHTAPLTAKSFIISPIPLQGSGRRQNRNRIMKIVIDEKIPFIRGAFERWADVVYAPGRSIDARMVSDADALIVRTRTRCDASLLDGSSVRIVASATIGFDHIDTGWLEQNGIRWANAPGCNSGSVMQYITSLLFFLAQKHSLDPGSMTLGIVGVGNVGSKVARAASAIGMKVLLNDPPPETRRRCRNTEP
jgi:hypothetical protein